MKPDNPIRNNTFGPHDRESGWKSRTQVEFEPKCNIQKGSLYFLRYINYKIDYIRLSLLNLVKKMLKI